MARGRKIAKIAPIEKKAPVESLNKIPDTANLNDYDKIVAKMANSSEDIIDKALSKLDGQATVNKIEKEEHPQINTDVPKVQEEDNVEAPGTDEVPEVEGEYAHPSVYIKEIQRLQSEVDELKSKISEANPSKIHEMHVDEINNLVNKNDDLILRNSELEFEISRLRSENNILKQKLESSLVNTPSIPTVNRQNSDYRQVGARLPPALSQLANKPRQKTSMNGYESWN